MADMELLAEIQEGLKERGIEATEEEIRAAIDEYQSGEISEENLEDVSGGMLFPLGFPVGGGCGSRCPRCGGIIGIVTHVCPKWTPILRILGKKKKGKR